ncbi:MAG: hypothetical protein AB7L92_04840 [Alphaproteobacteria bacterium]
MTKKEFKKEEAQLRVQDVVTLTARLAQILAEEVDLLSSMKVSKIADLQKEKLFLISALEAQKKLLGKHPHLKDTIPSQDKQDLEEVMRVFNDIMEENHHKLQVARKVNEKIVQAITDVVRESTRSAAYGVNGKNGAAPYESLSVTLNQTI